MVVRINGKADPVTTSLTVSGPDGTKVIEAHDFSHLLASELGRFRTSRDRILPFDGGGYLSHCDGTVTSLGPIDTRIYPDRLDDEMELLEILGSAFFEETETRWFATGCFVFSIGPARANARYKAFKRKVHDRDQCPVHVEVRLLQVPNPADDMSGGGKKIMTPMHPNPESIIKAGSEVAVLRTVLGKEGRALSIAGFEGLRIISYDVDVASGAAASYPLAIPFVDGAMIQLRRETELEPDHGTIHAIIQLQRLDGGKSRVLSLSGLQGDIDANHFDRFFSEGHIPIDDDFHVLGRFQGERDGRKTAVFVLGAATLLD